MFFSFFSLSRQAVTLFRKVSPRAWIIRFGPASRKLIIAPDPRPPQPIIPTLSGAPSGASSKRGGKFNSTVGFLGPEHELSTLTPMTPTALIAAALVRNFLLEKFDSPMIRLVLEYSI